MEIQPCKDDVISVIAIWPVILICEIFLLSISRWNSFATIGIALLDVLLCICSIRDWVYLSRTIKIEYDGCTFSLLGFSKKYPWNCIKIQLCDDNHFGFSDSDVRGQGVMISTKEVDYTGKMAAMTFCRTKYPFSSVYIRFIGRQELQPATTGKIVYYGYTAEKAKILEYIDRMYLNVDSPESLRC